jgi:predicted metalloprotease with PDZ domain
MNWCRLAAPLAALALMGAAERPAPVDLAVRPVTDARGYAAVEVTLSFNGEADGDTVVRLPTAWGGAERLYAALHDFSAEGASIDSGADETTRVLRHAPGARIRLSYRVRENDAGGAPVGNNYHPRMREDYFFLIGETFVVQPENVGDDASARFSVSGLPDGHAFASDLEHASLTFEDVVESVMLGGAVRVFDAGGGARLAMHGVVDARDDAGWAAAFRRVATSQRAFWRAAEGPYLVTVLAAPPRTPGAISVGGTGRGNAFAFFATSNAPVAILDRTLAHEMMHTWTPKEIGGMRADPEAADYWFSEGVTDWAAWRVMVRSGAWTAEDFAAVFNEELAAYDTSPVRTARNDEIAARFWAEAEMQRLPYRRGMLLITRWDAHVREATRGRRNFDDVLMWMRRHASEGTAAALAPAAMRAVAGVDVSEEVARHVEAGAPVELPEDVFGPCGQIVWIERAPFHRGFDIEATSRTDNIIAGVVRDGPAWRAGLRDGMRLLGRPGGEIGNPDVEIAYEVLDGETPRTLRWMPRGPGLERFRRFQLDPSRDEQVCRRSIGG